MMVNKKDYIPGHTVRLVHGGEEYFNTLLGLIESARKVLHLQVYILENDDTGAVIVDALKDAVRRGVGVYLLVDGFGSMDLGPVFKEEMVAHGIHFRFFSPLPFPGIFQAGRRLHHKVCVADGECALITGINISDKYRGTADETAWLDFGIKVNGPVCSQIAAVCECIYNKRFYRRYYRDMKKLFMTSAVAKGVSVRITINDWMRGLNEISAGYKQILKGAHKEIIIVASYFIPSRRLLKILLRAATKSKNIYIIVSKNSDVPLMKSAMKFLYSRLLLNKVRIFEYKESVLHAKVCVVDSRWVSVGSHNLNHLSEFLSIEMNLEVADKHFATSVAEEMKSLMFEKCNEIRNDEFASSQTFPARIVNWFSFKLISLSMRLLHLLNIKQDKNV